MSAKMDVFFASVKNPLAHQLLPPTSSANRKRNRFASEEANDPLESQFESDAFCRSKKCAVFYGRRLAGAKMPAARQMPCSKIPAL